ncbi:MAG TPA: DDE-type integrase/transposase/recombinase, partial [Candidatus Nanoarchaeia archaeon]|nr:DDE-type integrase/transposase/recombinase [Candidatus Nanoarchaeia archaeon]
KSKKYKVTINKGWYSCECPDNHESKNLCKHILFLKTYFAMTLNAKEIQHNVSVSNPCPQCNSSSIHKDGTRKTITGLKQKWLCSDCGKRFVNQPISKIKGNADTVITAIDLYMKGVSYRGIADSIKQFYGLKISQVTVMNWVNNYMKRINEYVNQMKPQVGDTWHADEQFIKVKGKQEYVWNVLDGDTRFLLASNESQTRATKDARETFQKAKAIAGKKAKTVITDGSFSYEQAVRKEFATYQNRNPHYRYVSMRAKDVSNNRIERFHESFRQRDKTMRNFQTNQKQYAENFKTYYNFVRQHQGLKQTPAQKAGLNVNPQWKELLEKSVKQPIVNSQGRTADE